MDIRDFIDVELLEKVMEEWSKATGMATIAMDAKDEYLTREIGFTDFCTKYTRGSKEGLRRCTLSDACNGGVYYCHAGLMDFSIDIRLNEGTYLGKVIGGQILAEKPCPDNFRRLAEEIGVDAEEYIDALSKIEIRSEEAIRASANLLGRVVNLLVNSEYIKKKQEHIITQMESENKMDPLTGVYNRSVLHTAVEEKIRSGAYFVLIIADIDEFKGINDTYGHMTGDIVLKLFSAEIKKIFRSKDVIGRFGGDEFYLVIECETNDRAEFERIGNRICEAARKMRSDEVDCQISVSVGIASWPEHGDDSISLFKKADEALYVAKKNGKNCCFVYQSEI